jgi:hypothetical protein
MVIEYQFNNDGEDRECDYFADIVNMDNYNNITFIDCGNNELKVLPQLPRDLETLWCENNNLELLPVLPKGIKELYCYSNQLKFLPSLPNGLITLWCFNNKLIILPILNKNLVELYCNNNKLQITPKFHNNFDIIDCTINPVDTYIKDKCGGNLEIYHRENEIFANKLVRWYLDCRENPIFKFCRTRLDKEYDDLMEEDTGRMLV